MTPTIGRADFAVLVRRAGVALTEEEIATLHEGYGWLQRLVADLGPPTEAEVEPALIFVPEIP